VKYRWMSFAHALRVVRTLGMALALGFAPVGMSVAAETESTAGSEEAEIEDLMDLEIEDLLNLEIVSVARKSQRLSEAAAAVYVITAEDLRRSGVRSIPDALRMAPGVQVAQVSGNRWAITARGFNGLMSNKLLVLMDGRSVYTPLYSGVYWDMQDTMIEDIERIEVIRGPGGTIWGANAVNGVINIVTKTASDSQGLLASAGGGNIERGFSSVRYGGDIKDAAYYRAYFKYSKRNHSGDLDGIDAHDGSQVFRGGWRLDWDVSESDVVTFQGDVFSGEPEETYNLMSLDPPPYGSSWFTGDTLESDGGNVLARWRRSFSEDSDLALQFYYDRTHRKDAVIAEDRDTWDVDFQHRFALFGFSELNWGAAYRRTQDEIENSETVGFFPDSRGDNLYSGFVQAEVRLVEDTLRLTAGTKIEHNDYTGWEVQPSGRFAWTPNSNNTLWGAVSRAVRTPSRANSDIRIQIVSPAENPGAPFPDPDGITTVIYMNGAPTDSGELLAFELGYRLRPFESVSLDLATFYNLYDNLPTNESAGPPIFTPPFPPFVRMDIPTKWANLGEGETYGVELAAQWRATDWLHLSGAYSFLNMRLRAVGGSTDRDPDKEENYSPEHQFNLRANVALPYDLEVDTAVYYASGLEGDDIDISPYARWDLRLGWRPSERIELAVVGQNLQSAGHQEFIGQSGLMATRVPRSVFGVFTSRF